MQLSSRVAPLNKVRYAIDVGLDHLTIRNASLNRSQQPGRSAACWSAGVGAVVRGGKPQIRAHVREALFVASRFSRRAKTFRVRLDGCALVQAHVGRTKGYREEDLETGPYQGHGWVSVVACCTGDDRHPHENHFAACCTGDEVRSKDLRSDGSGEGDPGSIP